MINSMSERGEKYRRVGRFQAASLERRNKTSVAGGRRSQRPGDSFARVSHMLGRGGT